MRRNDCEELCALRQSGRPAQAGSSRVAKFTSGMECRGGVATDSLIARPDEVHRPAHVRAVLGNARGRQRDPCETIERREELHRCVILPDQIV